MLMLHTPQGLIDLDANPATWGSPRWDLIGLSLSRLARWNGNTSRFYSVAEHSIRLWKIAPENLKRAALLHDAAEAFIGDVPAPIRKRAGGPFENYDSKISFWLFEQAGERDKFTDPLLWNLDRVLAATEYRDLCGGEPLAVGLPEPLEKWIGSDFGWNWADEWLKRFNRK